MLGPVPPTPAGAAEASDCDLIPQPLGFSTPRVHNLVTPETLGTPEMLAADMLAAYVDSRLATDLAQHVSTEGRLCSSEALPSSAGAMHAPRCSSALPVLEGDDAEDMVCSPAVHADTRGGTPAATSVRTDRVVQAQGADFTFSHVVRPAGTPQSVSPDWAPLQSTSAKQGIGSHAWEESPPPAAKDPFSVPATVPELGPHERLRTRLVLLGPAPVTEEVWRCAVT